MRNHVEKETRRAARRMVKNALRYTGIQRYLLLYMRNGKEVQGPWFNSRSRAHQAREVMMRKHGNAIVFVG